MSYAGALRLKRRWYTPCMGNLEKLPWIDAFALSGYGVRIGVRVSDPLLIPMLAERLPPGMKHASFGDVDRVLSVLLGGPGERRGLRRYHMLHADHVTAGRSHNLDHLLEDYDSQLRLALAQFSRRKLFIHAGCVALDGRAIVLPGNTMAGKSSLAMALVKAGATYLSDEYAVIDRRGMVHPFVKPISVRDTRNARQRSIPVEEIGGDFAERPLPIGAVLLTKFAEHRRWLPRRLKPSVAAIELMKFTVGARTNPANTLAVLSAVAAAAPVFRTDRPDVNEAVPALMTLIERRCKRSRAEGASPGRK